MWLAALFHEAYRLKLDGFGCGLLSAMVKVKVLTRVFQAFIVEHVLCTWH